MATFQAQENFGSQTWKELKIGLLSLVPQFQSLKTEDLSAVQNTFRGLFEKLKKEDQGLGSYALRVFLESALSYGKASNAESEFLQKALEGVKEAPLHSGFGGNFLEGVATVFSQLLAWNEAFLSKLGLDENLVRFLANNLAQAQTNQIVAGLRKFEETTSTTTRKPALPVVQFPQRLQSPWEAKR